MKVQMLNLELPSKYKDNLIQYAHRLDGVPDWIDFAQMGYSMQTYRKFTKLYTIESMKFHLNEALEENGLSDDEITEARKMIEGAITEYNEM